MSQKVHTFIDMRASWIRDVRMRLSTVTTILIVVGEQGGEGTSSAHDELPTGHGSFTS